MNEQSAPRGQRVTPLELFFDLAAGLGVSREQLENAPRYHEDDRWDWTSPEYTRQVDTHYRPFVFI